MSYKRLCLPVVTLALVLAGIVAGQAPPDNQESDLKGPLSESTLSQQPGSSQPATDPSGREESQRWGDTLGIRRQQLEQLGREGARLRESERELINARGLVELLGRAHTGDPEMDKLAAEDEQLNLETLDLAEQYRMLEGKEKEDCKVKLNEAVSKHFVARQARRKLELERLKAQVERLSAAFAKREKDSESIISRRVSQLTGEDESEF